MTAAASRYHFRDWADGFAIEGDDRPPVEISLLPTGLEAWFAGVTFAGAKERFGFFNFGRLLEFTARGLMRNWQPNEGWFGAKAWAERQTAKAIARRMREQWLRLLSRADANVLAVQKAIFAATFGDAPLAHEPALYEEKFLVQDLLRFPAAAIAVRNARVLARDHAVNRLLRSDHARALRAMASELHVALNLHVEPVEPDAAAQLAALRDWKALFSDTGEGYRSLNRTLMNLPGRVPHRLVCQLRNVHLDRPLEHRLELLVVALYSVVRAGHAGEGARVDHTHIFQHARPQQVRAAVERVAQHLRQTLSPRKAADVRQMVQFVADCPEAHAGTLAGLAERAVRWHRERLADQLAAMQQRFGANMTVATPPVPLPVHPEVTFLSTVGAICAEAERMQHCVASYIESAVRGNCFLFHITHKDEEATIEVGREGRVRQAQGPRNQRNKAAARGRRLLNAWATQFPPCITLPESIRGGTIDEDIPF